MVITKHGYYYSDKKTFVGLLGSCKCGCNFTTYVNIYHKSDGVIFVTDGDCPDMNIKTDEVSCVETIRQTKYSCFCPECRSNVELIPRVEGDNDRKI